MVRALWVCDAMPTCRVSIDVGQEAGSKTGLPGSPPYYRQEPCKTDEP